MKRGKPLLGYANPLLYKMQMDSKSNFDVVKRGFSGCTEMQCCGTNFGFNASIESLNWNPIGGLGTPNVKKMIEWLELNL